MLKKKKKKTISKPFCTSAHSKTFFIRNSKEFCFIQFLAFLISLKKPFFTYILYIERKLYI